MSSKRILGLVAVPLATVVMAPGALAAPRLSKNVKVFATGLNNPRGLTFGPDGKLYVAEGGLGGTMTTTASQCQQVPAPVGPYSGGFTALILKIGKHGKRTIVASGLPSSQTSPMLGPLVSGVADVAFLGKQLYALEAAAGCSHGLAGTSNGLLRITATGKARQVVNLSAYLKAHPVRDERFERDDFEPDGTWYSMVTLNHDFYAVEPNHQEIDRITPSGHITRVLDMSKSSIQAGRWIGPTSISTHGGDLYFGALGPFPIKPGIDAIWKLTPTGHLRVFAHGLTTVLGTAWDTRGRLYALESMTAAGLPGPSELGTGKVVQINPSGTKKVIATGLSFPTGITYGPDGALYVSNFGFGGPQPGLGQILRITVGH
jgi:hypothetical protein